jgi:hypothetical protein
MTRLLRRLASALYATAHRRERRKAPRVVIITQIGGVRRDLFRQ